MKLRFVPLNSDEELQTLIAIANMRLPEAIMVHNTTQMVLKGRLSKDIVTSFWAFDKLDVNNPNNNFILVLQEIKFVKQMRVLTLSPATLDRDQIDALEDIIDWSIPHTFGELNEMTLKVYEDLCTKNSHPVTKDKCCTFGIMSSRKDAMDDGPNPKRNHPHAVVTRPLTLKDAEEATSNWSYSSTKGTLEQIQDLILNTDSTGVYIEDTGELVAWILLHTVGYFTTLHCKDAFRGNGYAGVALNALAQRVMRDQIIPYGHATVENVASQKAFTRAGWELLPSNYWLECDDVHFNQHK